MQHELMKYAMKILKKNTRRTRENSENCRIILDVPISKKLGKTLKNIENLWKTRGKTWFDLKLIKVWKTQENYGKRRLTLINCNVFHIHICSFPNFWRKVHSVFENFPMSFSPSFSELFSVFQSFQFFPEFPSEFFNSIPIFQSFQHFLKYSKIFHWVFLCFSKFSTVILYHFMLHSRINNNQTP